jgi:hypothetical protein
VAIHPSGGLVSFEASSGEKLVESLLAASAAAVTGTTHINSENGKANRSSPVIVRDGRGRYCMVEDTPENR